MFEETGVVIVDGGSKSSVGPVLDLHRELKNVL